MACAMYSGKSSDEGTRPPLNSDTTDSQRHTNGEGHVGPCDHVKTAKNSDTHTTSMDRLEAAHVALTVAS